MIPVTIRTRDPRDALSPALDLSLPALPRVGEVLFLAGHAYTVTAVVHFPETARVTVHARTTDPIYRASSALPIRRIT